MFWFLGLFKVNATVWNHYKKFEILSLILRETIPGSFFERSKPDKKWPSLVCKQD